MLDSKIIIKTIEFGSKDYEKLLTFRFENLRRPLELLWTENDLRLESKQTHFALYNRKRIVGSCLLKKISNRKIRLRQMAIDVKFQKKKLGLMLLKHAENYSKSKLFNEIIIIARVSAYFFYRKNGFYPVGKIFSDVTVDSIKMIKKI